MKSFTLRAERPSQAPIAAAHGRPRPAWLPSGRSVGSRRQGFLAAAFRSQQAHSPSSPNAQHLDVSEPSTSGRDAERGLGPGTRAAWAELPSRAKLVGATALSFVICNMDKVSSCSCAQRCSMLCRLGWCLCR